MSIISVILLLIILMLHLPTMMNGGEQESMNAMSMILKDLGLLGAALYMSSNFKK